MIGSIGLWVGMGVLCAIGIWIDRRAWEKKRKAHLELTGYDFIDRE